jgi:DNA-binding transcriptional LysR family regulator
MKESRVDLKQLRCFVAVADDLHFGRAAQRLDMLPSALGRHIRLLEQDLRTRLLTRSTRNVALTVDGTELLKEARSLLAQADGIAARIRAHGRKQASTLRIGAIDSAAAGLLPPLLHDFRDVRPDVAVHILEDKTIRLLPRLLTGRLDLAFVRPPEKANKGLDFLFICHETAVVAVPKRHALAGRTRVSIADLADQPLIIPERRSRPHSHDLTMKLFEKAGLRAKVAQQAEEKQTIINLVAAELGVAIVPRWASRLAVAGVLFKPLYVPGGQTNKLSLAAAWMRGSRDPARDEIINLLRARLATYCKHA